MKALFAAALSLLCSLPASAQWATGNLIVLQVGDSTTPLTSAAAPIILQEYYPATPAQAVPVHTMPLPTTGTARIVLSGSAGTEGQMTLSADSAHLVLAGYDAAPGTPAVNGTTGSTVARVVDTINAQATAGRAIISTAFSTTNFRAATKGAGAKYWGGGGSSGVYFLGVGSPAGTLGTTATNVRALQAANGNLYYTSGAGTSLGLSKIAGQPTGNGNGGTLLFGNGSSALYGFAINATETVAYLTDDRSAPAGGLYKWVYTNGAWTLADTLLVGTGTGGGTRAVTVDWSGAHPVLYAITKDSRLVRLVDSSAPAGSPNSWVTLAAAPNNTAFRSVCFVPKGACPPAAISYTGPPSFCVADSLQLRTAGGVGKSFQWSRNDTAISGATDSFYFAVRSGTHAVEVTGGTCVVVSPPVKVGVRALPLPLIEYSNGALRVAAAAGFSSFQWLRNGTPIAGATDSVLVPGQDGIYTVAVVQGGCGGLSAPAAVSNVGIAPVPLLNEVRLFPNPVTGVLFVVPARCYGFRVLDVSGRLLLQGKSTFAGSIEVGLLEAGLYFCVLEERGTQRVLRFWKR